MDPYVQRHKVYLAAKEGNLETLKDLLTNLTKEAAVEILSHHTEEDGYLTTPFIIALRHNKTEITNWLLSNYNVCLDQKEGVLQLWEAVFHDHSSIVRQLLKHGVDPNHPLLDNEYPLLNAIHLGRSEIIKVLIQHGADVNTSNDKNETCLMVTCSLGFNDIVKLLLDKGADIDAKSCDGSTALHKAAKFGHVNIVKTLVCYKASVQEDDLKMTPLLVAAAGGQAEVVEYLVLLPDCTVQQRVDAFELLGASIMMQFNYDMSKAFKYLHMGMSERYRDSTNPLIKSLSPPKPAYGNHIECQTLDEIESLAGNLTALRMEALTVRERIQGDGNPDFLCDISDLAEIFASSGQLDISNKLWLHASYTYSEEQSFYVMVDYLQSVFTDVQSRCRHRFWATAPIVRMFGNCGTI